MRTVNGKTVKSKERHEHRNSMNLDIVYNRSNGANELSKNGLYLNYWGSRKVVNYP